MGTVIPFPKPAPAPRDAHQASEDPTLDAFIACIAERVEKLRGSAIRPEERDKVRRLAQIFAEAQPVQPRDV